MGGGIEYALKATMGNPPHATRLPVEERAAVSEQGTQDKRRQRPVYTLETFYRSKEWETLRQIIIAERTRPDGFVYDEETGRPILRPYDLILHHKIFLTEENVNDATIALNPDNIEIVSHRTHNRLHDRLGMARREVFLVYGPPLAGKTSWVQESKSAADLVLDLDAIWLSVTGGPRYSKPPKLRAVVFRIRDELLDIVKHRYGKWSKAYIIGGYPNTAERERLTQELGAVPVYIEASQEECLRRLEQDEERNHEEWRGYIADWFTRYTPPVG